MNDIRTALSVDGLSIRFGGVTAVESMSFEVREGEVLSLIGPNGAGKTSAFNAITGYLPAATGDIVYRGTRLNGLKPSSIAALGVVRTFQKTSVFAGRSVLDNILIGLHLQSRQHPIAIILGLPSVAREERRLVEKAQEVLQFVGIELRKDDLASSLAYGELRLLEVAVALAARPTLLLLDEPVAGMNSTETASFMETLASHPLDRRHSSPCRARHEDGDARVGSRRRVSIRAASSRMGRRRRSNAIRTSSAPILAKGTLVLKVEGLTCRYGKVTAVSELSLEVHRGELVSLIGANGAGKTTTLKAISGLVVPAGGRLIFEGEDITGASARRVLQLGVAHCPEGRRVFPYMTVIENLQMGCHLRRDAA